MRLGHSYAGTLDSDGHLWLVGRSKDVIRTGSENVHATEVESVLELHPCILRAAVVGIPHNRLGEQVSLMQHCKEYCMHNCWLDL